MGRCDHWFIRGKVEKLCIKITRELFLHVHDCILHIVQLSRSWSKNWFYSIVWYIKHWLCHVPAIYISQIMSVVLCQSFPPVLVEWLSHYYRGQKCLSHSMSSWYHQWCKRCGFCSCIIVILLTSSQAEWFVWRECNSCGRAGMYCIFYSFDVSKSIGHFI